MLGLRCSRLARLRGDNLAWGGLQSGWENKQEGADDDPTGYIQAQSGRRGFSLNADLANSVANYQI